MYRQGRSFQGLAGGVFILFLALAIISHGLFLPLFFIGLGLSALFGTMGTVGNKDGAYGGFLGFVFFLGLASCSLFHWWWPGILVTLAVVAILSSFSGSIRSGFLGGFGNNSQSQPTYQPPQQSYQPQPSTYQPPQYRENYQEGYQPPQQARDSYQEGGQNYNYPPTGSTYEQPQPQYPPQEMPPQR
jgi:hypothetical protein